MIIFACSCGMKFKVKPDFAGRSTKCPTCKQVLTVPVPDRTAAHVPAGEIDGTQSSLAQAGVDGGVTVAQAAGGGTGQKSVTEILSRRGKKDGRYIIEKEIARGGMGAVLRAVDCDIRREVAVKYMLGEADPKKKLRFIEEAQITGQLEHPNIVPIHELGVDAQKRVFFSMKMVKGKSLADVLDELRKNPRVAESEWGLGRLLNVFVNVCNGLAYAHSRDVVHRDLKPANIMVGGYGEVYVMDWGLAKVLKGEGQAVVSPAKNLAASVAVPVPTTGSSRPSQVVTSREAEADLTQEGAILGTPVYMPPEQANGQVDAIDQRSDIYSLGAILYEMLALQAPIDKEGGYLAILMRVTQGEIVVPERRNLARAIPIELSAISMKAMAKNPGDRYQTVEAMRNDIQRFQEGRSVSAKEDTFKEMAWKLVKRNKLASAFTALLAVVVGVGAVVTWLARRDVEKAQAESQEKQQQLVDRTRKAVPALTVAARQVANTGKIKEALDQIDLTLLYEPEDADAHLLRGQLLIGQKDWAAAREALEKYLQQKSDADARKLLSLCSTGKANDAATQYALADVLQRQNVPGPAIPLLQEVAVERKKREPLLPVYQKQVEVNWPGLGGQLHLSQEAQFTLNLHGRQQVTTLEPLKGMQLNSLDLGLLPLHDLTPLQGMPLRWLNLHRCQNVRDLTPLIGMPLNTLYLNGCTQVRDLTPLNGLPLTDLNLPPLTNDEQLKVLKGMSLTRLSLEDCWEVGDLTPLRGLNLIVVYLPRKNITKGMDVLRQMKSLTTINAVPSDQFWKQYDARGIGK